MDVLTGQGHGGTGLRFYERDTINKAFNYAFPALTNQGMNQPDSLADAKSGVSGLSSVAIEPSVVTATFGDYFYVESMDSAPASRSTRPPTACCPVNWRVSMENAGTAILMVNAT